MSSSIKLKGSILTAFACLLTSPAVHIDYASTRAQTGRRLISGPGPGAIQVEILAEEEAIPGKAISVTRAGKRLIAYTCKAEDAAVVAFALLKRGPGLTIFPQVVSADAPDGSKYLAKVEPDTTPAGVNPPVYFITVKRGFDVKPGMINVQINATLGGDAFRLKVPVTHIASPRREVSLPSPKDALAAERTVKVYVDDQTGTVMAQALLHSGSNDMYSAVVVDSSFGVKAPVFLPSAYAKAIDAVKVEITRVRTRTAETTLVYRNAKIVTANGKPFLYLPDVEKIGAIRGFAVYLSNSLPRKRRVPLHDPMVHQDIQMEWEDNLDPRQRNPDMRNPFGYYQANLVDTTPNIADLGLDLLHVGLTNRPDIWVGPSGFSNTLRAFRHPLAPKTARIPELKFHIQVSKSEPISSQTLIVPVTHSHKAPSSPTPKRILTPTRG